MSATTNIPLPFLRLFLHGDFHLPAGCTDADIDRHFDGPEDCPACGGVGEGNRSDCCHARLDNDDQANLVCPSCGAPCQRASCPGCDGTGIQRATDPDDYEDDDR